MDLPGGLFYLSDSLHDNPFKVFLIDRFHGAEDGERLLFPVRKDRALLCHLCLFLGFVFNVI